MSRTGMIIMTPIIMVEMPKASSITARVSVSDPLGGFTGSRTSMSTLRPHERQNLASSGSSASQCLHFTLILATRQEDGINGVFRVSRFLDNEVLAN